jgi:predicted RNase H-like HicB family nuclease
VKYAVVIERTPNNYAAYVPDLPGCISVGDTEAEVLANIREAIELHLDSMREDGDPIPAPTTVATMVEITDQADAA